MTSVTILVLVFVEVFLEFLYAGRGVCEGGTGAEAGAGVNAERPRRRERHRSLVYLKAGTSQTGAGPAGDLSHSQEATAGPKRVDSPRRTLDDPRLIKIDGG